MKNYTLTEAQLIHLGLVMIASFIEHTSPKELTEEQEEELAMSAQHHLYGMVASGHLAERLGPHAPDGETLEKINENVDEYRERFAVVERLKTILKGEA